MRNLRMSLAVTMTLSLLGGAAGGAAAQGPPRSTEAQLPVAVPAIDGLGTIDASLALRDTGLDAASVVASSETVPAGTVFDQSPAAGTLVDVGSTVSYSVSLVVSQVAPPIADYWGEWTAHRAFYRGRSRYAMAFARNSVSKTASFYQKLVGIHGDELTWLANHRPAACYASEYRRWHRAVMNLRTIHRDTMRFLRAGNTAGVRRAARAERAGIKRLNRARSTVSPCEPSPPRTAPPGNPFVGKWKTLIDQVAWDGFHRTIQETVTIRRSGRIFLRNDRDHYCRKIGHGFVPLTYEGSGRFDLDGSPPSYMTSGRLYCHPQVRGRTLVVRDMSVGPYRYDEAADVMIRQKDGLCHWRRGSGGPKDCKSFWRGAAS